MEILNTTYLLLITIIIMSLFCYNKIIYIGIIIRNLATLYQGIISIAGFSTLALFAGIICLYFNYLPKQQILAIIVSTLIFGTVHFQGGLTFIILSSIGGFFNGYTYYKTKYCTLW